MRGFFDDTSNSPAGGCAGADSCHDETLELSNTRRHQSQDINPMQSLNYLLHLEKEMKAAKDLNKGQRTRMLLMYNTAVVMERSGIAPDLVAQVCSLSNVARGSFYTYFKDSLTATMAVLQDFLTVASGWIAKLERHADLFDSFVALLRFQNDLHAQNSGLLRCLYVLNPQDLINKPYRLWQKVRHGWRMAIAQQLEVMLKLPKRDRPAALHVAYALVSTADELLFQMYLADNRYFRRSFPNTEYLIETVAIMWYRALTGENPPTRRLKTPARDIARIMKKAQSLAL